MSSKSSRSKPDPRYAMQAILSRRDHATAELKIKLGRQGYSSEQVEEAIEWGRQKRLINDQRFAQNYITSLLRQKPVGRRWLVAKLRQKGVPAGVVKDALDQQLDRAQETKLAREAAATWHKRHPQYESDTVRLARFLQARGFSFEVIRSTVANSTDVDA